MVVIEKNIFKRKIKKQQSVILIGFNKHHKNFLHISNLSWLDFKEK